MMKKFFSLIPLSVGFSLIFFGQILVAKKSTAELLEGAKIINRKYPQTHSSGRFRVDKISVYNQTFRFHYTSFLRNSISEQKTIFWADVITRSKMPNLSRVIYSQGSLRHRYSDSRGNFLFEFIVTPSDLKRF
jgi:hypothetical protein